MGTGEQGIMGHHFTLRQQEQEHRESAVSSQLGRSFYRVVSDSDSYLDFRVRELRVSEHLSQSLDHP